MGTIPALLDWSCGNLQEARTPSLTVARGMRWRGGIIESRQEETPEPTNNNWGEPKRKWRRGAGGGLIFFERKLNVIRATDGWQVVHLAGMDKGVRWDLALTGNAGSGLTTEEEERKIPVGCSLILCLRHSSRCDAHAILRRKGQTDLELDRILLSCCKKNPQ